MKRWLISALMLFVCLWLGNTSKANILTLYPTNDAYIQSDEPDSLHNNNTLYAGYTNEITRSYIMFNLSSVPDDQSIVSAVLRLSPNFLTFTDPVIGAYYLLDDNWSESTLTWNNAPTNFNIPATDTQTITTEDAFFTVSSDVSHAYGDNDIYSVVLKLPNEVSGAKAGFWSKDFGIADNSPQLTIEYQPIPEPVTLVLFGLGGLILKKRKS